MASNDPETNDADNVVFDLLKTCGVDLFDKLEKKIENKIPESLRKILLVNEVESITVLARIDDTYKRRGVWKVSSGTTLSKI